MASSPRDAGLLCSGAVWRSAAAGAMPAKKAFRRRREDEEEDEEDEQVAEEVRWVGSRRRARLGPSVAGRTGAPGPAEVSGGTRVCVSPVVSCRYIVISSHRHVPRWCYSAVSCHIVLLRRDMWLWRVTPFCRHGGSRVTSRCFPRDVTPVESRRSPVVSLVTVLSQQNSV